MGASSSRRIDTSSTERGFGHGHRRNQEPGRPDLGLVLVGGIANPLEVIEQITYLLFIRRLDDLHTLEENKANRRRRLAGPRMAGGDRKIT
jgi:HsdM-like protein